MRYIAILALFWATSANAGLIHQYQFLLGSGETGTFSYDDGGQSGQVLGLNFTSFDLSFMGKTFDAGDVLFGFVTLNSDGTLNDMFSAVWGNNCSPGTCTVLSQTASPGSMDFQFQFFGFDLAPFGKGNFSHGFGDQTDATSLSLTYLGVLQDDDVPPIGVPAPGTMGLLLIGGLALWRAKARSNRAWSDRLPAP